MLSKTFGSAVYGIDATTITVEVNVLQGTKFFLVGLPDNAVKESQQRVESSIKHFGYNMPRQKVDVNLAPADIRKEGSAYDLPIGLSILKASNQILAEELEKYLIMGELSLDGVVRPIKGALPIAIEARKQGFKGFILPKENATEAGQCHQAVEEAGRGAAIGQPAAGKIGDHRRHAKHAQQRPDLRVTETQRLHQRYVVDLL